MNYPLLSEYITAIKSAEDNFNELSNLRPVLNDDGEPVMTSGNFAVVFKMKDKQTGKLHAVKCFLKGQEGRAEAYQKISAYINSRYSPYLVKFKYIDKELFVDSQQSEDNEFSVLQMEWVEGITLDSYMRMIKEDEVKRSQLAENFRQMTMWFLTKPFAHGDIKPDNILITSDNEIKLIDYDGMFVPSMDGENARESGSPFYRHPNRMNLPFDKHIDDYTLTLLLLLLCVNVIDPIDIEDRIKNQPLSLINSFSDEFLNSPDITPVLSAYFYVNTFGFLDDRLIYSLIASVSQYNFELEKQLKDTIFSTFDTKAMIQLADMYAKGVKLPKDESSAHKWYSIAILFGDVNAICGLCRCIYHESALSKDSFEQIAKNGYGFAFCRQGEECFHKDREKGYRYFRKGIGLNSPQAMEWLSSLLSSENEEESFNLLKRASEMGLTEAQRKLAESYEKGKGCDADMKLALYWYQKAADSGDETAHNSLANIYYYGKGVTQNYEEAVKWYIRAAERKNEYAQYMLGVCYYNGQGVIQNYEEAVKWYIRAAERKNEYAQYMLGICYYYGKGVTQNFEEAVKWYSKAAEQEYADAQNELGSCYYYGVGIEQNYVKAAGWYRKAAEQGLAEAQNNLGFCYEKEHGVMQDYDEAMKWYRKAAEQGYSIAQNNLDALEDFIHSLLDFES